MKSQVDAEAVQEFTRGQRIVAGLVLCVCFLVVGGSAFWVSYEHIRFVALLKHQPAHLAWVYPLTVDGMLGIGAVALWQDSVRGMVGRPWARFVFWLGLGVSIGANVVWYVAVWGWDAIGVAVAAWPAFALLCSVEVVTNPSRRRKVLRATAKAVAGVERLARSAATILTTPHTTTAQTPATGNGSPMAGEPASVGVSVQAQPSTRRWARPEDTEPLDQDLVDLALKVGRQWRERTGREITRDALRAGLRDAGWHKGISNVTAGRLLELIRSDVGQNTDGRQEPATSAANGR
jgi:hypothetical protein